MYKFKRFKNLQNSKNYEVYRDGILLGTVLFCENEHDAKVYASDKFGRWETLENGDMQVIYYTVVAIEK